MFRMMGGRACGVLLAGLVAACDGSSPVQPGDSGPAPVQVAYVGQEAGKPALFVQDADGTGRHRIRLDGAVELPGNFQELPVRDASILALGPVAWSPDGQRLAVVVTLAYDQSEVVVVGADGSSPRVASLNTQIVMSGVDWSPDGKKLVYALSTRPGAGGVQVFTTDLEAGTWRQVTKGTPVGSPGTDVRWTPDATGILLWRTIGQTPAPGFEWLTRIEMVELATGEARVLADSVVGMVQDVSRGGAWALLLRDTSRPQGQDEVRELVRRPLVGDGPELRLAEGNLLLARLSPDDRGVSLVSDADPTAGATSYRASALPATGGTPRALAGVDPAAFSLEVRFR